jgi:heme/copper-type cytochrome/quinol oxidase subunit 3
MNNSMLTVDFDALPVEISGHKAPGWWGMVLLIVTEASLFACLIASYFYLRSGAHVWPLGGLEKPKLPRPILMTCLLLASSAPMAWADISIRRGNVRNLRIGLALSFVLGAAFLSIQALEYHDLTFSLHTNAYSSIFLTTTSLHGMHVIGGLLATGYTFVRACLGHFRPGRNLAVQNTALYWHFVDAVWIVIFTSLYLSPRFL